uniref:Putative secreted protein n=1 Tax=Panstrongylus lignarius TaxID=156445 RepID=A0A224Y711_9HEMI
MIFVIGLLTLIEILKVCGQSMGSFKPDEFDSAVDGFLKFLRDPIISFPALNIPAIAILRCGKREKWQ